MANFSNLETSLTSAIQTEINRLTAIGAAKRYSCVRLVNELDRRRMARKCPHSAQFSADLSIWCSDCGDCLSPPIVITRID